MGVDTVPLSSETVAEALSKAMKSYRPPTVDDFQRVLTLAAHKLKLHPIPKKLTKKYLEEIARISALEALTFEESEKGKKRKAKPGDTPAPDEEESSSLISMSESEDPSVDMELPVLEKPEGTFGPEDPEVRDAAVFEKRQ